ncbi:DNA-binding transcriptional ArsR family regulator [Saccharothrix coeruleofusca]|uniref:ArsR/SmtB family transcription factor n=1 Tax=Saccharothrix coeruleofusca TaxID=33919 RepID=UPI001AE47264|nr:helix-turn-helix domain-containing protein [Saccharothrix coeruleofusca]MBP2337044.1 DNA-binding transcriptional ArsR family regulator [Saccharothrix coeruleofusca]
MLRVHFTPEDLLRTTVAGGVDPLWEVVFSRLRLVERDKSAVYAPWLRRLRTSAAPELVRPGRQVLTALTPLGPYFPDFLTPPEGGQGIRAGVEAIRATSPRRLGQEIGELSRHHRLPSWAQRLRQGDEAVLADVSASLRSYYGAVVEPHTDAMLAAIEADRAHRARVQLDRGVEGLLGSMSPLMVWRPPVLEVRYRADRDLFLGGRGLRLVPSYFCRHAPVALADPALPPTLVYPVHHDYSPIPPPGPRARPARALAALLGANRAAVLAAAAGSATTGELAQRLGLPASSVSRHTALLRDAGLITTRRRGPSVLHTTTPLGDSLLRADAR